jgi:anti-sigma regulatory factor (Ser/Thr protein kinase)
MFQHSELLKSADVEIPIQPGLYEHVIIEEHFSDCLSNLPDNISRICDYGFSEMLNNALDHSEGSQVTAIVERYTDFIRIWVIDDGVGIFNKLKRHFKLRDEKRAILELSKGKLTTDNVNHAGQGIFFTSRSVSSFTLTSNRLCLLGGYDKTVEVLLDQYYPGTIVLMEISMQATHTMAGVFNQFSSPEAGGFGKTCVSVRLVNLGKDSLVSRSQAKMVLSRLETFEEATLDFTGITSIGQGFAHEIFRVYMTKHPGVKITPVNACEEVSKMIQWVLNSLAAANGRNKEKGLTRLLSGPSLDEANDLTANEKKVIAKLADDLRDGVRKQVTQGRRLG